MNLRILPLLAAIGLLASCTSGTEGIFASLEREQKIISLGGLSPSATVTSMAESGGKYYATGGKALFSRSTTGTTWDKSTVGGSTEVQAVGVTASDLWAVANRTLYRLVVDTWTPVAVPGTLAAIDLIPVRSANGHATSELVLVTDDGGKANTVFRISGPTVGGALDLKGAFADLSAETQTVTSAATDGTNYYLACESFLWKVDSGFTAATRPAISGIPISGYRGLIYFSGTLTVSTRSNGTGGGGLYQITDTTQTTWAFTAIASDVKVDSNPVSFGQFMANATNSSIWVATESTTTQEGNGYMELDGTVLSTTPNTDQSNYKSSILPKSAVGTFFRSSTAEYFLGTVAHGLWSWNPAAKTWSQQ